MSLAMEKKSKEALDRCSDSFLLAVWCWVANKGFLKCLSLLLDFKELKMCQAEWVEAWKSCQMQRENRLIIGK